MKVLLLSPLAGLDPANGDVTYTQQLLEHPPEGVEYVDYAEALRTGALRERARRSSVRSAAGAARAGSLLAAGAASALDRARRRELLFREPLRFFEVAPGAFDLVHAHVFSVGYRGAWPPIVMSNSVAVEALYRDGLGWPAGKVVRSRRIESLLSRTLRADHTTYHRHRAQRLVAFTEHLKAWWVEQGVAAADRIDVVPCSVEEQPMRPLRERPHVVGFFAGAPEVKGLDRAFAAFQRVQVDRPDLELHVLGAERVRAWNHVADAPGVRWLGRRPRDEIVRVLLPSFDVMLHPTRFDGLPLSVLEAMSVGVPVVVSSYRALPEVVGDAAFVADGEAELATALRRFLEREANHATSYTVQQRQRSLYSGTAVLPMLLSSYRRAVEVG